LPAEAPALHELGAQIADLMSRTDPGPVVPTHGDLYEANLLVTGKAITGLLDIDSVGPGHRVDDLACLLGHALVLPCLAPAVYPLVPAAVQRWLAAFDRVVDPAALRVRVAGVLLSLVPGAVTVTGDAGDDVGRIDAAARSALARDWTAAALAAF
ncbi:MAG TPA: phosphotransferase, partial [Dermatophilaceae bacterium]